MSIFDKITNFFGDPNERALNEMRPRVEKINELEAKFESFSDQELREQTEVFRKRLDEGESLDDILPEAFAVVREGSKRTLEQRHYDEQLLGGISLHRGEIIEMKTGEGKTLAATLPAYLNALTGDGVHIVTVNDYLARRDTVWMGQIYAFLGLDVACIQQGQDSYIYDADLKSASQDEVDEKRDELGSFQVVDEYLRTCDRGQAYDADITYGTNNEFGFDYLRDNMVYDLEERSQNGQPFAILDEIDSILIDEARTPLIISQPDETSSKQYNRLARIAPKIEKGKDYEVDQKKNSVTLTEAGMDKVEELLGESNIFEKGEVETRFHIRKALKAHELFERDDDYIIKDGEVVLVDEFTGRLMPGRRLSEGLHQAIEAKEGVEVKQESKTLATITFQNYFRKYEKLSGMTGTAKSSSEEFHKVYDLDVVVVPTHEPLIRNNMPDRVYQTKKGKRKALIQEIRERHKKGQPLLIGTASIDKNEAVGKLLDQAGIEHNLLNAKNHEQEAQIIAQAGKKSAVTVATNMAGRGVDIVLGGNPPDKEEQEEVVELGGLHVIGMQRHEARRIDNQLRGRAGRQGDPGSSQFFVSLEDELMQVFGSDRVKNMMGSFGIPEDQPIENKMVSNAIERAQNKIEGRNFDIRKQVLKYDNVTSKQREAIYDKRETILEQENREQLFYDLVEEIVEETAEFNLPKKKANWRLEELTEDLSGFFGEGDSIQEKLETWADEAYEPKQLREKIVQWGKEKAAEESEAKKEELTEEGLNRLIKQVYLRNIDLNWMQHLTGLDHLRDSVGLRAYGKKDPLVEYKNEAHKMFEGLLGEIKEAVVKEVLTAEFAPQGQLGFSGAMQAKRQSLNLEKSAQGQKSSSDASKRAAKKVEENAVAKNATKADPVDQDSKFKDVGRNDPCPCGSGKKFKNCHWKEYR